MMEKVIGKLVRVDLGTGGWKVLLPNGTSVDLYGEVPEQLEGKKGWR